MFNLKKQKAEDYIVFASQAMFYHRIAKKELAVKNMNMALKLITDKGRPKKGFQKQYPILSLLLKKMKR